MLYISAQLNSYPHIGTLVNFISAFALAKLLKQKFNKEVSVCLDLLENVTGEEEIINGNKYYKGLNKIKDKNGKLLHEKYLPYFKEILEKLNQLDKVNHKIQFFKNYQKACL